MKLRKHVCFLSFLYFLSLFVHGMTEFHTGDSSTFQATKTEQFSLTYADGTTLSGYMATDIIQLGPFFDRADLGCIEQTDSPLRHTLEQDGIVGFAFPNFQTENPLLYSLLDKQPSDDHHLTRMIFSVVLTKLYGDLQLGGYVEESVLYSPKWTNVLKEYDSSGQASFFHFAVKVDDIKYGGISLFYSASDSTDDDRGVIKGGQPRLKAINSSAASIIGGILDSGTSCLVLPSTKVADMNLVPYDKFESIFNSIEGQLPPFTVRIDGADFTINKDDYLVDTDDGKAVCVLKLSSIPDLLLLGDPFFKRNVVVHDMTDSKTPRIGIAEVNPNYNVHPNDGMKVFRYNNNNNNPNSVVSSVPMPKSTARVSDLVALHPSSFIESEIDSGKFLPYTDLLAVRSLASEAIQIASSQSKKKIKTSMMKDSREYRLMNEFVEDDDVDIISHVYEDTENVTRVLLKKDPNVFVYLVPIKIGTPRQDFGLIFDTGSAALAVVSRNLFDWSLLFMILGTIIAIVVICCVVCGVSGSVLWYKRSLLTGVFGGNLVSTAGMPAVVAEGADDHLEDSADYSVSAVQGTYSRLDEEFDNYGHDEDEEGADDVHLHESDLDDIEHQPVTAKDHHGVITINDESGVEMQEVEHSVDEPL